MKERELAWDCATGTGQVAVTLAPHFDKVIATDASKNQIEKATPNSKIDYRVAPAEQSGLENHSVDLTTVAQAIHWFDFEAFYKEVNRVGKPGSVLAVWTYWLHSIEPELDKIIRYFYHDIVGSYWPPERKHVEEKYDSIPFPFEQIEHPSFEIKLQWNLPDLLGYLSTWSSSQRYLKEKEDDPILVIKDDLQKAWGKPDKPRQVTWPIILKMGYIS